MTRPALLLLPGLLCDETVWAAQCADLAEIADCRVPVYRTLASIEAMAGHVLATAPSDTFAMAGHSMGGRVALEVIRRAPERVLRLALLDTGFQALAAGNAGAKERAGRYQLLERVRAEGMRAMGEQWARAMVRPERIGDPVFEAILQMIARNTPDMFESQIRALLARPDATALLPLIGCPVLLLCGARRTVEPAGAARGDAERHFRLAPGSYRNVGAYDDDGTARRGVARAGRVADGAVRQHGGK